MTVFIYSSFVFGAAEESETRRTERWRCSFIVASCLEQQRNQKQGEQKDDGVHL